ncbi:MAG: DUF721 domain-containing protein [Spirochaetota bacterium]|nr:DUF721 domain-containing protein [Spirochaetota bacterium]
MKDTNSMHSREIEKINQVLFEFIHKENWQNKLLETKAIFIYNTISDDTIQKHTKAIYINNNELMVNVESPIYANQLSFKSQEIISSINRKLKKKIVTKIKFNVGDTNRENNIKDFYADPLEGIKLSEEEKSKIHGILSDIEDKEIKNHLNHLYSSALKYNKQER